VSVGLSNRNQTGLLDCLTVIKHDLYAGKLRQALEHDCGKQKASASILFLHVILLYVHIVIKAKCRVESDLGLCTFSGFATMQLHGGDFRLKNESRRKIRWKMPTRSRILLASPEIAHRPRPDFPLHFDI